jgi:phosphopantothenoylcysteine decarboxylase
LHIDLRDWADLLLIAPLSAHTLAKLSNGLCDDTLSCVVRAWDFGHGARPGKPLILVPAMNTAMWQHPLTRLQLDTIRGFWNTTGKDPKEGVSIVPPQVKKLACGEIGNGALASVEDIVKCVTIIDILSGVPATPTTK